MEPALPPHLRERAARIRLVGFDVDGTLTDGRLWFDAEGRESKAFHAHDGLGLRLLEDSGIAVAWITARDSASARARARDLRLTHIHTGVHDKLACLRQLMPAIPRHGPAPPAAGRTIRAPRLRRRAGWCANARVRGSMDARSPAPRRGRRHAG